MGALQENQFAKSAVPHTLAVRSFCNISFLQDNCLVRRLSVAYTNLYILHNNKIKFL